MAPIVHCVRHAQGEHNTGGSAYLIRDPGLTQTGINECQALQERFPNLSSVDLIVSSPLKRALYTAIHGFHPAIARGVPILALPELQETSDIACDVGSELDALEKEFSKFTLPSGGPVVDFGFLENKWYQKKGKYYPSSSALISRARTARQWLRGRPEKEVVVVSHGGFLHYLTNDWTSVMDAEHGTAWENCGFRSYSFTSTKQGDDAFMIETRTSRSARGLQDTDPIPSQEEQVQLYLQTMQKWEDRGFQNPLKTKEKDPSIEIDKC